MMAGNVGIYFSTMSGNTERIAGFIGEAIGVEPKEIDECSADAISALDVVFVGAPTWNTGADTERSGTSMDTWLYDTLPKVDMKGKTVALFGCGDSVGYSGNFCDSLGELHDCFTERGATIKGSWSLEDYMHYESKAVRDDKFVGLVCDEQNQMDLSEERVTTWVSQLKGEGVEL